MLQIHRLCRGSGKGPTSHHQRNRNTAIIVPKPNHLCADPGGIRRPTPVCVLVQNNWSCSAGAWPQLFRTVRSGRAILPGFWEGSGVQLGGWPSFSGGFAVGARSFPTFGRGGGFGPLLIFRAIRFHAFPSHLVCARPAIGSIPSLTY